MFSNEKIIIKLKCIQNKIRKFYILVVDEREKNENKHCLFFRLSNIFLETIDLLFHFTSQTSTSSLEDSVISQH